MFSEYGQSALRFLLMTLLLGSCILLSACGLRAESSESEDAEEEVVAIAVEVATVTRGDVTSAYTGTATLESERHAQAVAKLGGIVLEILAEEGDVVESGQVLARLERDRYEFQARQTAAALRKIENELERARELHQRNLISTDEYERLRFDAESQQASHDLAQLDLQHTEIRAPISGVIAERMVKTGNLVTQYQPLFVIDDFDPLWAVLHVPERELNLLAPGQTAELQVDAYPGINFAGEVLRISPVVDATTGTFRATVSFSDPSGRLRPGLFGRVQVIHDRRNDVPLIAHEALLSEDGETAVFVTNSDAGEDVMTVERRIIETGYRSERGVEVLNGLSEGERVVTAGKNSLRDGASITIIES
ncbi:MAG: efflux RND transporter periplasmic adaptor subunit [Wenzhouxiangella sp.]|jgi:membrane fusion protein (multidrug efflux system)|nr:efflux RND transporter periplasmic adaptor subunit [Wenzhouxiangella sp.]